MNSRRSFLFTLLALTLTLSGAISPRTAAQLGVLRQLGVQIPACNLRRSSSRTPSPPNNAKLVLPGPLFRRSS
jgi:hypothetical protein